VGMGMVPEIVGIVVRSSALELIAWKRSDQGYCITDYLNYPFEDYEIHDLVIFNLSKISSLIRNFNKIEHVPVIIALDADLLSESLTPDKPIVSSDHKLRCETYKLDNDHWYTACLPYHVRAHYHFLAALVPFTIIQITTLTLACYSTSLAKNLANKRSYTTLALLRQEIVLCGDYRSYAPGLCYLAQV
jgi:hypothetical protein